jgi:hypothetical protein
MKPRVYLETTIPSYLTAWPSRDLVRAAHQQITRDWWDRRRAEFELYISQVVVRECQAGDATAAAERLRSFKTYRCWNRRKKRRGSRRPLWIECRYPSGRRSMPCTWRSRRFTEWITCSPGIARTLPTQRCGTRSSLFAERMATSRRRFAHQMNYWPRKGTDVDDILLEVRKAREAYAKEFGYDLQAIHRDLKAQEQSSGRRIVSLPSRRPKPTMANGTVSRASNDSGRTTG